MTDKQIAEMAELKKEGCSIREIAGIMGIPKSNVERGLKEAGNTTDDVSLIEAGSGRVLDRDVQLKALEFDHERKMAEMELRKEEVAIQRQKFKVKELEAQNQRTALDADERLAEREEQRLNERTENRKAVLVSKFNRLVQELLDNCKKATWEGEEINEYLVRVDALKEKLFKFCERHGIDEEELAIWYSLHELISFWEKAKEDLTGWFSDDVELDCTVEEITTINSWFVSEFDEVIDEPETARNTVDSDEDEDNEDEDDEQN